MNWPVCAPTIPCVPDDPPALPTPAQAEGAKGWEVWTSTSVLGDSGVGEFHWEWKMDEKAFVLEGDAVSGVAGAAAVGGWVGATGVPGRRWKRRTHRACACVHSRRRLSCKGLLLATLPSFAPPHTTTHTHYSAHTSLTLPTNPPHPADPPQISQPPQFIYPDDGQPTIHLEAGDYFYFPKGMTAKVRCCWVGLNSCARPVAGRKKRGGVGVVVPAAAAVCGAPCTCCLPVRGCCS